jgi:hypothetical protein
MFTKKELIAADFFGAARAHGERPLRLKISPISKHPNFKNVWQPQLFKCSFRIA